MTIIEFNYMPYIHINKETKEVELFGNLASLSFFTGIKKYKLHYIFSKKKLIDYENEYCLIHKRYQK